MNLADLEYLNTCTIPAGQTFFRIQRARATRQTVRRGPLKLAPAGVMSGRFDLVDAPTAYLAEAPETALYEAVFRREATSVSIAALGQRELLAAQLLQQVQLGDLRPHAGSWPVLQSLRHSQTQELAAQAHAAGFDGFIYRSAQQFGQDCIVLFDPGATSTKALWRTPLTNAAGAVSRWVAAAVRGSGIPLVP
ncbi:RES family NAD+ phosphorylase [Azohydromonas aeria]|uniref:RES family NAD+ phosphorylase n=1 Tax=Azohydromonas aeria TaxID=2590212 RepID=UPI0012FBEABF|nr:RES family NAD+ phosphorylase [Azohydromonas aeria]